MYTLFSSIFTENRRNLWNCSFGMELRTQKWRLCNAIIH